MSKGKITAFLIGGVVGAGLAALLTPRSGSETRAKIAECANGACGEASGFAQDAVRRTTELAQDAVSYGQVFAEDVAERVFKARPGIQTADEEAADDALRAKIEAARARIASQVAEKAREDQDLLGTEACPTSEAAAGAAPAVEVKAEAAPAPEAPKADDAPKA